MKLKVAMMNGISTMMMMLEMCRITEITTLGYLLQLLQLLCPSGNQLPKSVYMLRNFFKQFGSCK